MATDRETGWNDSSVAQTYSDPATAFAACSVGDTIRLHYPTSDGPDGRRAYEWTGPNAGAATEVAVGIEGVYGNRTIEVFSRTRANWLYYATDLSGLPNAIDIENLTVRVPCSNWTFMFADSGGACAQNITVKNCALYMGGGSIGGCNASASNIHFEYNLHHGAGYDGVFLADATSYAYNCTIIGCAFALKNTTAGIRISSGVAKNCLSIGNYLDCKSGGTQDYNFAGGTAYGANSTSNLDWPDAKFWGENCGAMTAEDYRITTASSLYHAGTNLSLGGDCDGNAIHATTPSIGWHEGTAEAFGVTWPTEAQVQSGVNFTTFDCAETGSLAGGGGGGRRSRIRLHGA